MKEEFNSKTEKYLYSRDHRRKAAKYEFLKFNEESNLFIASINELVSSLTLFLSGKSLRKIENGLYIGDLVVSFCRSHFIACDLILGGELVEAAIVIRKQLELLSRVNELSVGLDADNLTRKTPNIRYLKTNLKKIYSEYSEIAHSASPEIMHLLGRKEHESRIFTNLYPEFQKNAYVSMQHLTMTAFEFHVWCVNFNKDNFSEYDSTHDSLLLDNAINQYKKIFSDSNDDN